MCLTITLRNTGVGNLDWDALENETWIISITPDSGSILAGGHQAVSICVDRATVVTPQQGVIYVSCNNCVPPQTIYLIVTIDPPPLVCNWISYDDGAFEDGIRRGSGVRIYGFVQFTRPNGWSGVTITEVKLYRYTTQGSGTWDIAATDEWESAGGYYYPCGGWVTLQANATQDQGWHTYDVTDRTLTGSRFFVAVNWDASAGMYLGVDVPHNNTWRSGYTTEDCSIRDIVINGHFGIQVRVCESTAMGPEGAPVTDSGVDHSEEETKNGIWIEGTLDLIHMDGSEGVIWHRPGDVAGKK
jgi:hypothetical protein